MITEDYVSFETAKLLKEKGFGCGALLYYYDKDGDLLFSSWKVDGGKDEFDAPTLQMTMKWLREVHKLCITITPKVTDDEGAGGCLWEWTITYLLVPQSVSLELFESYEEACEAAIKYCLEKLI